MSRCEACDHSRSRPRSSFVRVQLLLDSNHEDAYLERCQTCTGLFGHLWLEVFDDFWDYWVPVSESEAEHLQQRFRSDKHQGRVHLESLVRTRRRLVGYPKSEILIWGDGPTVIGLPAG